MPSSTRASARCSPRCRCRRCGRSSRARPRNSRPTSTSSTSGCCTWRRRTRTVASTLSRCCARAEPPPACPVVLRSSPRPRQLWAQRCCWVRIDANSPCIHPSILLFQLARANRRWLARGQGSPNSSTGATARCRWDIGRLTLPGRGVENV
ncbi:hypothetical protein TCAP_00786 [Tolypocladium capitatum]|uniref:Uncharacterized protein n=1 Tax=Tolypocladium capitatum TaxID=45235 RepID=A0A2K3QP23_9HYPO|nr:hypothetical protein TCAP_00786 [Tolypocladium capitatum]